MPRPQEPLCRQCGRMVSRPMERCEVCVHSPPPLQQVRAPLLFSDPVPDIIHQLKYNGLFALAGPLAQLMVDNWPRWQTSIDLILPVPLSRQRRKERGYNQSELLVRHICRSLKIDGSPNALHRIRHTRPQVDLSASERRTNVAGAFRADREKVANRKVLLVDDVYTTGSTMTEGAKALLAAGAESVSGYCLARVS